MLLERDDFVSWMKNQTAKAVIATAKSAAAATTPTRISYGTGNTTAHATNSVITLLKAARTTKMYISVSLFPFDNFIVEYFLYFVNMPRQSTQFDFGDAREPSESFQLFEHTIEDRGSKYSVSIGRVEGRGDIKSFLKQLKANKKYAKATHNSWAARLSHDGAIYETKSDDGETGAGMVILRILQKENVTNCVVCVTRWFGGVKLQGDRFKHVQDATKYAVDNL